MEWKTIEENRLYARENGDLVELVWAMQYHNFTADELNAHVNFMDEYTAEACPEFAEYQELLVSIEQGVDSALLDLSKLDEMNEMIKQRVDNDNLGPYTGTVITYSEDRQTEELQVIRDALEYFSDKIPAQRDQELLITYGVVSAELWEKIKNQKADGIITFFEFAYDPVIQWEAHLEIKAGLDIKNAYKRMPYEDSLEINTSVFTEYDPEVAQEVMSLASTLDLDKVPDKTIYHNENVLMEIVSLYLSMHLPVFVMDENGNIVPLDNQEDDELTANLQEDLPPGIIIGPGTKEYVQ